jgi:hypothetical protein
MRTDGRTDTQTQPDRYRQTDTDRHRQTDRYRHKQIDTARQIQTGRQTDIHDEANNRFLILRTRQETAKNM